MILQHRLKGKPDEQDIQVLKEYSNLPLIECYAGLLNQVFMNIMTNAIDALKEAMHNGQKLESQLPSIRICTSVVGTNRVMINDDLKQLNFYSLCK